MISPSKTRSKLEQDTTTGQQASDPTPTAHLSYFHPAPSTLASSLPNHLFSSALADQANSGAFGGLGFGSDMGTLASASASAWAATLSLKFMWFWVACLANMLQTILIFLIYNFHELEAS